jgi:hypothetical protein
MVGAEYHALPWIARIGEHDAEGVDLVKEADDGRLLGVRIIMRPVQAIQAWAQAMTTRMGMPSPPHG